MRNATYYYTGVKATEQQEHEMRNPLPYMVIGNRVTESSAETIHGYAIGHGLPEIKGYYGYDFAEHEFIRLHDATEGEPDAFPSRLMSDVLKPVIAESASTREGQA